MSSYPSESGETKVAKIDKRTVKTEKCEICGQIIDMEHYDRDTYAYKFFHKHKIVYACSYKHLNELKDKLEKKKKPKSASNPRSCFYEGYMN